MSPPEKKELEQLVCLPYCRFYKGGREEMACAGLQRIRELFSRERLDELLRDLDVMPWDSSEDGVLARQLCDTCDFRVDGCGFREGEADSPPCGGYILLELLIRQGRLQPDDLCPRPPR